MEHLFVVRIKQMLENHGVHGLDVRKSGPRMCLITFLNPETPEAERTAAAWRQRLLRWLTELELDCYVRTRILLQSTHLPRRYEALIQLENGAVGQDRNERTPDPG